MSYVDIVPCKKVEIQYLKKTISNWKQMRKASLECINEATLIDTVKQLVLGDNGCPLCEYYQNCSMGCPLYNAIADDNCDHGNRYAIVNDMMLEEKPISRKKWNMLCDWIIGRCEARIKKLNKKGKV